MAGERVLYVCFDPTTVLDRERSLLDCGYEVHTVLGRDGLMAVQHIDDVEFIVIGDEGVLSERQRFRRMAQRGNLLHSGYRPMPRRRRYFWSRLPIARHGYKRLFRFTGQTDKPAPLFGLNPAKMFTGTR